MKLLAYILFEKYIYILALEMASAGNQHCANRIDTLLFATGLIAVQVMWDDKMSR